MSLLPGGPYDYGSVFGGGPSWLPQGQRSNPFGMGGGGLLGAQQGGWRGLLGNQDLALALLANSGYGPKRSFGEILGTSALQAKQMGQERDDSAFKREYMQAQMEAIKQRAAQQNSPWGAIQPDKFTPESLAKFEQTGKYSDLELRNIGMQYGRYNPGDFTPESWARFIATDDPSVLVRYVAPANPTVGSIAGDVSVIQPSRTGGQTRVEQLSPAQAEIDAAARRKEAEASGAALGDAAGAQGAKAPNLASFNTAAANMRKSFELASQGMVAGPAGSVYNYGNARLFDARKNQLSTELRAVFRIPGEGEISDREQEQYNLQLPDRKNPPEVNEQIISDLEARIRDRLATPIGTPQKPTGAKKRYNPATGRIE